MHARRSDAGLAAHEILDCEADSRGVAKLIGLDSSTTDLSSMDSNEPVSKADIDSAAGGQSIVFGHASGEIEFATSLEHCAANRWEEGVDGRAQER